MLRWLVRLVVVSAVITGASLAVAFSTGPATSKTGAPSVGGVAAEGICRECHTTFPLNTAGATLEILDVPASYSLNTLYDIRVRMTSTFALPRRWGFQITAVRELNGQGSGSFDLTGATGLQMANGSGAFSTRQYVNHTQPGTFDDNQGPVEWTLRWRSPTTNEGRIFFFAAGNAANSNNLSSGDHIYTTSASTSSTVGVPGFPVASLDLLEAPRPNPFSSRAEVSYVLVESGVVDLSVFDAQGRRVTTLVAGDRPAGRASVSWDGSRDDGATALPGVYFVRLVSPGMPAGVTRRVTFIR